jgi:hypothetical protein
MGMASRAGANTHTVLIPWVRAPKIMLDQCANDGLFVHQFYGMSTVVFFLSRLLHLWPPESFSPEISQVIGCTTIVDRIFPSSMVNRPPIVQPPGVATAFLIIAGC